MKNRVKLVSPSRSFQHPGPTATFSVCTEIFEMMDFRIRRLRHKSNNVQLREFPPRRGAPTTRPLILDPALLLLFSSIFSCPPLFLLLLLQFLLFLLLLRLLLFFFHLLPFLYSFFFFSSPFCTSSCSSFFILRPIYVLIGSILFICHRFLDCRSAVVYWWRFSTRYERSWPGSILDQCLQGDFPRY